MAFRDGLAEGGRTAGYYQSTEQSLLLAEELGETMRQASAGRGQTSGYRVYLLGLNASIDAAEHFLASGDAEAVEVADILYAACCDVFSGYELWRGRQRIDDPRTRRTDRGCAAAVENHRAIVLDLMEKLRQAFACVGRSRKLLATYNRTIAR